MENKDKSFARKAFKDAMKAAKIDDESRAAKEWFDDSFTSLLAAFVMTADGADFLKKNNGQEGIEAINKLANIFFYGGFRSGVIYQSKKKQ